MNGNTEQQFYTFGIISQYHTDSEIQSFSLEVEENPIVYQLYSLDVVLLKIDEVTPVSGKVGDVITLTGVSFGNSQGNSKVYFKVKEPTETLFIAEIISWSDTTITCKVPTGITSGIVYIYVYRDYDNIKGNSNEVEFYMTGLKVCKVWDTCNDWKDWNKYDVSVDENCDLVLSKASVNEVELLYTYINPDIVTIYGCEWSSTYNKLIMAAKAKDGKYYIYSVNKNGIWQKSNLSFPFLSYGWESVHRILTIINGRVKILGRVASYINFYEFRESDLVFLKESFTPMNIAYPNNNASYTISQDIDNKTYVLMHYYWSGSGPYATGSYYHYSRLFIFDKDTNVINAYNNTYYKLYNESGKRKLTGNYTIDLYPYAGYVYSIAKDLSSVNKDVIIFEKPVIWDYNTDKLSLEIEAFLDEHSKWVTTTKDVYWYDEKAHAYQSVFPSFENSITEVFPSMTRFSMNESTYLYRIGQVGRDAVTVRIYSLKESAYKSYGYATYTYTPKAGIKFKSWSSLVDKEVPTNTSLTMKYNSSADISSIGTVESIDIKADFNTNDSSITPKLKSIQICAETTPSVQVLSPNGGETFTADTTQTITWKKLINCDKFKVYYMTEGQWIYLTETTNTSYNWTIPNDPSDKCLIKVEAYIGSEMVGDDVSDNYFKIVSANYTVTVTSPNGNEILEKGENYNITWTYSSPISVYFKIYISLDNGINYTLITDNVTSSPYPWNVNVNDTIYGKIKIEMLKSGTTDKVLATDTSDNTFTIIHKSLAVNTPSTNEVVTANTNYNVTWTKTGTFTSFDLYYSRDNKSTWNTIATSLPSTTTSYSWPVPDIISSECYIKLVGHNSGADIVVYSGLFKILPAEGSYWVKIISPDGSTSLTANSDITIKWSYQGGEIKNFYIEYDNISSGQNNIFILVANVPTTQISWKVPDMNGYIRIRIKARANTGQILVFAETGTLQVKKEISDGGGNTPLNATFSRPYFEELIYNSQNYLVQFTITGNYSYWHLDYALDGGNNYTDLSATNWVRLASNQQGMSYTWSISGDIISNQARLRLLIYDSNNNLSLIVPSSIFEIVQKVSEEEIPQVIDYFDIILPTKFSKCYRNYGYIFRYKTSCVGTHTFGMEMRTDGISDLEDTSKDVYKIDKISNFTVPNSLYPGRYLKVTRDMVGIIKLYVNWQKNSSGTSYVEPIYIFQPGNLSFINVYENIKIEKNTDFILSIHTDFKNYEHRIYYTLNNDITDNLEYGDTGLWVKFATITPTTNDFSVSCHLPNITSNKCMFAVEVWKKGSEIDSIFNTSEDVSTIEDDQLVKGMQKYSNTKFLVSRAYSEKFSICDPSPTITITNPTSSSIFYAGDLINVSWQITGSFTYYKIYYYLNGVWNYSGISVGTTYSFLAPNQNCSTKVKVEGYDDSGYVTESISSNFEVRSIVVRLLNPRKGERVLQGSIYKIQWDLNRNVDSINLYFSSDGGENYNIIASNLLGTKREFLWHVPNNIVSKKCLIKIEAIKGTIIVSDISGD